MLREGEVFAGYSIHRPLGHGGMGSVYLARHPRLPRWVALKLLKPELFADSEIAARFEREAEVVAGLDHPGIVTVFDRGVEKSQRWISMRYVDGSDASSLGVADISPERALRIVGQIAEALDYAHSKGVLHRDVKPANILLARANGPDERALLADFGIARLRDDTRNLTQTGAINATLAYASPEQLTAAAIDGRADQYSLACTLYRFLSGRTPFEASNPATVIKGHLQDPMPSLRGSRPDLPVALDAVLAKGLAKRPGDRYGSCAELAAAAWQSWAAPNTPHIRPDSRPQERVAVATSVPPSPSVPVRPSIGVGHSGRASGSGRISVRKGIFIGIGVLLTTVVGVGAGIGAAMLAEDSSQSAAYSTTSTTLAPTTDPVEQQNRIDEWQAAIDSISRTFPQMVPPSVTAAETSKGYMNSECTVVGGVNIGRSSSVLDMKDWVAQWGCSAGDTDVGYSIYKYRSTGDVRSVIESLPSVDMSVESKNGNNYTNYTVYTTETMDLESAHLITTFPDDPGRQNFILSVSHGFMGRDKMPELLQWWRSAPLD